MTASASDAPVRPAGLRTRSGNAMQRTRTAILDAALDCLATQGVRRTTMTDLALAGGVAKATLYNHFRTKDDVLAALVDAQVAALADACRVVAQEVGLAAALEHAADHLAGLSALRRVADEEPALLAALAAPGDGRGWQSARAAVASVLAAGGAPAGDAEVELVLRWALSQLHWPAGPATAGLLAAGLGESARPAPGRAEPGAEPSGLGWPAGSARLRITHDDERR